ncbi:hypothetical protein D3C87_1367110 [compost metagenome]
MLPAPGADQPDHQGREGSQCKILSGLEHRSGQTTFVAREPHNGQAVISGKRRRFRYTHHKAQNKQREKGGTEEVNVPLQECKHRPDDEAHSENDARAKSIKDDAARQLHGCVRPAECREGDAHGHGIEAKICAHAGGRNGQRRPINVIENCDDEDHHED